MRLPTSSKSASTFGKREACMVTRMKDAGLSVLGVDVGGTFVDVLLVHDEIVYSTKVLADPDDLVGAVMTGVVTVLQWAELEPSALEQVSHATTRATNAIIERKGACVGLLTTAGFKDVLEIGSELRYDLYDLFQRFPAPLVPRWRRYGVEERVTASGVVERTLDEANVKDALHSLEKAGIESLAICFLHSYAHPDNERRAAELAREHSPVRHICTSHSVLPEVGEYGRFSTTVANAYVQPVIDSYFADFEKDLADLGFRGTLDVVASHAGTMTVDAAREFPVRLVESGPAAGAYACGRIGRALELENLVSFDMGGTTAKVCLVTGGTPSFTSEFEAARIDRFKAGSGLTLKTPAVDLLEIGAGGGGIARVTDLGLLEVGPQSAGAMPGPACYNRGGTEPTVTDANLVLGFLNPEAFAGSTLNVSREKAEESVRCTVGEALQVSVQEAAWAIYRTVNDQMASAMRVHAAEKGVDLRRYSLFAFGSAAPLHACAVAALAGVRTVIVPPAAGVLAAGGCIGVPRSSDMVQGWQRVLNAPLDRDELNRRLAHLEKIAFDMLGFRNDDGVSVELSVDTRFAGQTGTLSVSLPYQRLDVGAEQDIEQRFRQRYAARYGREVPDVDAEVVNWRLRISGGESVSLTSLLSGLHSRSSDDAQKADSAARWVWETDRQDFASWPVYWRGAFEPDAIVSGPAIIEDEFTSIIVPASGRAKAERNGHIVIGLEEEEHAG